VSLSQPRALMLTKVLLEDVRRSRTLSIERPGPSKSLRELELDGTQVGDRFFRPAPPSPDQVSRTVATLFIAHSGRKTS